MLFLMTVAIIIRAILDFILIIECEHDVLNSLFTKKKILYFIIL